MQKYSYDEINISNINDLERMYINEIRKYDVLTKEEEIEHFKVIEKYRNYIKKNNITYETLTTEINKIAELENITLDDTNYKIVIDKITNSSISESSKKTLINKIKMYILYQKHYDIVFKQNLRLVVSIATKYYNQGIDFLDLVQEGNIGLICAINKYKLDCNTKFSTYAYLWIKQKITRKLYTERSLIRIPVNYATKVSFYRNVLKELVSSEKDLTFENIYNTFIILLAKKKYPNATTEDFLKYQEELMKKVTKEYVLEIQRVFEMNKLSYLEEHVKTKTEEDSTTKKIDLLESKDTPIEDEITKKELIDKIKIIISQNKVNSKNEEISILTITEKIVLCLRFGIPLSDYVSLEDIENLSINKPKINLEELSKIYFAEPQEYKLEPISNLLGLTRARIGQIEQNGLLKIRTIISKKYKKYFDEYHLVKSI